MKKVMFIGKQSAGKTTFCQKLLGEDLKYNKTQSVSVLGDGLIDTPGEYLEQRLLYRALIVTSADADIVALVIDAQEESSMFSPGINTMFSKPVIGIITKIDIAADEQINNARELLFVAGASDIFKVSSVTGEGFDEILKYLS